MILEKPSSGTLKDKRQTSLWDPEN